jgi:hypothetical protein
MYPGFLARSGELVRMDAVRVGKHPLEIRFGISVHDQGSPGCNGGAQPSRVVEVVVRVDDVPHGLARHQLVRGFQHRFGAPVVERTLDEDDVVLHLDRDTVVRAAGEEPDAFRGLFGGHPLGSLEHGFRHGHVGGRVDLYFGNSDVEHRKAPCALLDPARKLDAAVILIIGVGGDDCRVAEDRIGDAGIDALHEIVVVDQHGGGKTPGFGEGNRGDFLAAFASPRDGGPVPQRGKNDSVRRGPQVVDARVDSDAGRCGRGACHVPRIGPVHIRGHLLFAGSRHRAAAGGLGAAAREVFAQGSVRVVGHSRETGIVELRPRPAGLEGLAERRAGPAARKANRLQVRGAHGSGCAPQQGFGVLGCVEGSWHEGNGGAGECDPDPQGIAIHFLLLVGEGLR